MNHLPLPRHPSDRPAGGPRRRAGLFLLLAALLLARPAGVAAGTLHVPTDYPTILDALIRAGQGDTVLVAPGEYKLYFGNLTIQNRKVTLKSSGGPAQTRIIGRPGRPVITFARGSRAVLQGFTITGTTDPEAISNNGGGIYCAPSSAPVIIGCVIRGNQAVFGGGIYCDLRSAPVIVNNEIRDNTALVSGGGIFSFRSSAAIVNNRLQGNRAGNSGGGISTYRDSSFITNCFLWRNRAGFGGGVSCERAATTLANNTVTANRAGSGGGILIQGGSVRLTNLILWQNRDRDLVTMGTGPMSRPNSSDLKDRRFRGVNGNITADPLFVDPAGGDFHLRPGSPCINTGSMDPFYNDVDGSRSDMGGYGGPAAGWNRPLSPWTLPGRMPGARRRD